MKIDKITQLPDEHRPRTADLDDLDLDDVVDGYAAAMERGDVFPPVVVYDDGATHWLADGAHRVAATKQLGRTEIEAEVRQGSMDDAVAYAIGANTKHGLPLSYSDKHRAIMIALEHPTLGKMTHAVIARHVGVSDKTVTRIERQALAVVGVLAKLSPKEYADALALKVEKKVTIDEVDDEDGRTRTERVDPDVYERVLTVKHWLAEVERARAAGGKVEAPKRTRKDGRKQKAKISRAKPAPVPEPDDEDEPEIEPDDEDEPELDDEDEPELDDDDEPELDDDDEPELDDDDEPEIEPEIEETADTSPMRGDDVDQLINLVDAIIARGRRDELEQALEAMARIQRALTRAAA